MNLDASLFTYRNWDTYIDDVNRNIDVDKFMKSIKLNTNIPDNINKSIRNNFMTNYITHRFEYNKNIIEIVNLDKQQAEMYKQILIQCPDDKSIYNIDKVIRRISTSRHISGRTIDMLMTKYHHNHTSIYNLCIDHNDIHILEKGHTCENCIVFNIGSSYKRKMKQYSKSNFDCFGRGDMVRHKLKGGGHINIHICQFMFFIWLTKFKIIEYMEHNINDIKQKSTKQTNIEQNVIIDHICPSISVSTSKLSDISTFLYNKNKKL